MKQNSQKKKKLIRSSTKFQGTYNLFVDDDQNQISLI